MNIDKEHTNSAEITHDNPSFAEYMDYQNAHGQLLRIGLFGDDLVRTLESEDTIGINYTKADQAILAPLLTPIDQLEWFNTDLSGREYGNQRRVLVYTHPQIPDSTVHDTALSMLHQSLLDGDVIIAEKYTSDEESPIAKLLEDVSKNGDEYTVRRFGENDDARVDFFAGRVKFNSLNGRIERARTLNEVYEDAVSDGILPTEIHNGPSVAPAIIGSAADQIIELYREPFEELGQYDPTLAGFDDDSLREILGDESITKLVYRADGQIASLIIFLDDFSKAPWFNVEAYKREYPDFYETGNIFIFPGIVTDKSKQGNQYASKLVEFAMNLFERRGSDVLITFECTQISTTYVPGLVQAVIESGGTAQVDGLDEPVSSVEYFGISKNQPSAA